MWAKNAPASRDQPPHPLKLYRVNEIKTKHKCTKAPQFLDWTEIGFHLSPTCCFWVILFAVADAERRKSERSNNPNKTMKSRQRSYFRAPFPFFLFYGLEIEVHFSLWSWKRSKREEEGGGELSLPLQLLKFVNNVSLYIYYYFPHLISLPQRRRLLPMVGRPPSHRCIACTPAAAATAAIIC